MFKEKAIVANLDINNVTWARTYLKSAEENRIEVTDDPNIQADKIFIGDNIPIAKITDHKRHLYFLGASSITPSDSENLKDIEIEFLNMNWADLVLVVSNAEKWKILSKREYFNKKILVNGFPLNLREINMFKTTKKIPNSVCFLGETRYIKNTDFEICLIENLKRLGYEVCHLSSKPMLRRKELEHAGCRIIENVEFKKYWEILSKFKFFTSTSFYESLCISGIEAFALGCTPIVPDHSGFKDWCPDNLRYKNFDEKEVIDIMKRNENVNHQISKLAWYDSKSYFMRINFI